MEVEQLREALAETLGTLREHPVAPSLAQTLRRVCHDINNALGTLALEHYSLGAILDDVAPMLPRGELEELRAALGNGEAAREAGEAIVAALHASARALDPAGQG